MKRYYLAVDIGASSGRICRDKNSFEKMQRTGENTGIDGD